MSGRKKKTIKELSLELLFLKERNNKLWKNITAMKQLQADLEEQVEELESDLNDCHNEIYELQLENETLRSNKC